MQKLVSREDLEKTPASPTKKRYDESLEEEKE